VARGILRRCRPGASAAVTLDETLLRIRSGEAAAAAAVRAALDAKTKPRNSLGRLEELACRLAFAHGAERGVVPVIVVAAADHGVAREGVSAYPAEVTKQMLANFESGGAAVCVLARAAEAELRVVDAGGGNGTANLAGGPAISRAEAVEQVSRG